MVDMTANNRNSRDALGDELLEQNKLHIQALEYDVKKAERQLMTFYRDHAQALLVKDTITPDIDKLAISYYGHLKVDAFHDKNKKTEIKLREGKEALKSMIDEELKKQKLDSLVLEMTQLIDASIEAQVALVLEKERIEIALAIEKEKQQKAKTTEAVVDAHSTAVMIVNSIRKFLEYSGQAILLFAQAIRPIAVIISGVAGIWDSIKALNSKVESDFGKGAKVTVNILLVAIGIAGLLVGPLAALVLALVASVVAFFKDGVVPLRSAQEAVDQKEQELAAAEKAQKEFEASNGKKSDLYSAQCIKLTNELNVCRVKLMLARRNYYGFLVVMMGTVLCCIPFPPVQIVGVFLLLASTVEYFVNKYKLYARLENFFTNLFNPTSAELAHAVKPDLAKQHAAQINKSLVDTPVVEPSKSFTGLNKKGQIRPRANSAPTLSQHTESSSSIVDAVNKAAKETLLAPENVSSDSDSEVSAESTPQQTSPSVSPIPTSSGEHAAYHLLAISRQPKSNNRSSSPLGVADKQEASVPGADVADEEGSAQETQPLLKTENGKSHH